MPWKLTPKTFYDQLLDRLFDIPAIHRQSDELGHETDQTVLRDGFRDVVAKSLKVESDLRSLFENFEKSTSGPLYWPELSTIESRLDDVKLGKVYPVSFLFPAHFIAQLVTTYWSGMMTIHHQLMYTYNKLAAIESPTKANDATDSLRPRATDNDTHSAVLFDLRAREHSEIWRTMAKNICQSADYYLHGTTGGSGPVYMLPLLVGCRNCLQSAHEDSSREISWIADIMERIVKRFDFPVSSLFEP
jgi:hypothetical protein